MRPGGCFSGPTRGYNGQVRAEQRFDPVARTVSEARRFVRAVLTQWSISADEATLLVSELATNAVLHARTPYTVTITRPDQDRARVEVTDDDPSPPRADLAGSEHAPGGRGIVLVSRLSYRWGCDETPAGKTVWFEV